MTTEHRNAHECTFKTSDGVELFYRHWESNNNENKDKAIIMFHRGHEHSGRLQHIVDELEMPDCDFFAWDARGHGMSPGERGYSPSIARSAEDIEEFVRFISENYHIALENIIVIAQSVGAVLAATWIHDYAPKIRGAILASPAFDVKLYVPFAKQGISGLQKLIGTFYVNSYVKAKFLTHDPERIKSYQEDKLIAGAIASNILSGLYETSERIIKDARAITLPIQMFISGADYVVNQQPEHQFFNNLSSPIKEKYVMDGFFHDTLGEKDRAKVFEKMKSFINKLYSMPPYKHDYINADRWGATADELRTLQTPLKPFCPKNLFYKFMKSSFALLSRFSDGIKIGVETGFDSGSSLDYIYKNTPSGCCCFGRFLDKIYLDNIGWKGIRVRKTNMERTIKQAVSCLKEQNRPVRILDIAAGHGRYILDAISDIDGIESVLLRDYSDINIEKGKKLIEERSLSDKADFIKGDAFNRESIASTNPKPTIGIVSGLYELFSENDLIRTSLAGMADAIEQGGYLIYTNQPSHPQLELIARALTSHRNGQPWAMRCRVQGEMDALVEEAGFEKINEYIDEWGIFSVSLARKK